MDGLCSHEQQACIGSELEVLTLSQVVFLFNLNIKPKTYHKPFPSTDYTVPSMGYTLKLYVIENVLNRSF